MGDEAVEQLVRLRLRDDSDVAVARVRTRECCEAVGFNRARTDALVTAVSEVARNAVEHAAGGELMLGRLRRSGQVGVVVVVSDRGPGIPDIDAALRDGFSTGEGLGLGLPGARRLVSEFELCTTLGEGTTITLEQWSEVPERDDGSGG